MKSLKRLFVLLFVLMLVVPFNAVVMAEEDNDGEEAVVTSTLDNSLYSLYNTMNLREALADEEIEEAFDDYTENDDQVIIYLFRGKGCSHCREFLTFLNSIVEEYGDYFRVVTFEVWNDANNSELMQEVANYLGEEAGGVPFIVIGNKAFPGYATQYDEEIKQAIINEYNTPKEDRYDVLAKKDEKPDNTVSNIIVGAVTVLFVGGIVVTKIINKKNEQ